MGLALAILDDQRYQALTERLRQAGFSQDENEDGKPTRQRWQIDGPPKVTVDFLIPPSLAADRPGTLRNIESDFAAIIAPGLQLAFVDRERVRLDGKTIVGEVATSLENDFSDLDGVGPRRVADFLRGARDEELQADVRGLVLDLVARCKAAER